MKSIFLSLLLLVSLSSYAQEQDKKKIFDELLISVGGSSPILGVYFSVYELQKLYPELSPYLNKQVSLPEMELENEKDSLDLDVKINFCLNASVSHSFKNPRFKWIFGIHYNYGRNQLFSQADYGKIIIYSQTSGNNYTDSSNCITSVFNVFTQTASLENSIVYKSKPERRIGSYVGLCTQVGFCAPYYNYYFHNTTSANYHDSTGTTQTYSSYESLFLRKNGNMIPYFSTQFKLGIELNFLKEYLKKRPSKKEKENSHFFLEYRLGSNFMYIPELHSFYFPITGSVLGGMRISL